VKRLLPPPATFVKQERKDMMRIMQEHQRDSEFPMDIHRAKTASTNTADFGWIAMTIKYRCHAAFLTNSSVVDAS
jgi:hypothetical protein